jgi:hypothetical protein
MPSGSILGNYAPGIRRKTADDLTASIDRSSLAEIASQPSSQAMNLPMSSGLIESLRDDLRPEGTWKCRSGTESGMDFGYCAFSDRRSGALARTTKQGAAGFTDSQPKVTLVGHRRQNLLTFGPRR